MLPSDDFFNRLAKLAPRKVSRGVEVVEKQGVQLPNASTVSDVLPPPFEWCLIPLGTVTLEDAQAQKGTKGGEFEVSPFYMAKYPITNAQFQAFVEAEDGYGLARWWSYSSDAREWYARNPTPQAAAFGGAAYHPRVNVTWYEAVAFCHWLNERAQPTAPLQIRLPTEQEWQYAAQGSDCPPYPGATATIPLAAIHWKAASNGRRR